MQTMSDKTKVEVLLAEYRACHMNRNNYDSVVWTIGSIFIAASFTLLGISFVQEIRIEEVALLAGFSLASILIWTCYKEHVGWFIKRSLDRMEEIEKELRNLGFGIKLHSSIRAKKQIRGVWNAILLTVTVFAAWIFRILLFYDWFVTALSEHLVTLFFGLITWVALSYFILYVYYKIVKRFGFSQTGENSSCLRKSF